MSKTVGVLGLGIMGSAMARNLLEAGFAVAGLRKQTARLSELKEMGGHPVGSAQELAQVSDVVVSVLPTVESVHEAILGKQGVAAGAHPGLIMVEASTMPLDVKLAVHDGLAAAGVTTLDCPLSGTGGQAGGGVRALRQENSQLKELVADLSLKNVVLKKSLAGTGDDLDQ